MAEVAYQWGELHAALRYLTEGVPLTRQFSYPRLLTTGLAKLAWIRQARGDAPGAWDVMCEAQQAACNLSACGQPRCRGQG